MWQSLKSLIKYCYLILILVLVACSSKDAQKEPADDSRLGILVLGVAQDAGIPQSNCSKACCIRYFDGELKPQLVTCLAIVDKLEKKYWLIEATPDIKYQIADVNRFLGNEKQVLPEGIFISHAHIGHYTGLMQLGREAIGANSIPVFAMPRMKSFLEDNGPWSQLVALNNISLQALADSIPIALPNEISVTPFEVPHRDEFSETIGLNIKGPNKSILFIPDIDKWNKWSVNIKDIIPLVDLAFVDGTFNDANELPGRDMSEIPHPFITESMNTFDGLDYKNKTKINFIHFNHTNSAHIKDSEAYNSITSKGYKISTAGQFESL